MFVYMIYVYMKKLCVCVCMCGVAEREPFTSVLHVRVGERRFSSLVSSSQPPPSSIIYSRDTHTQPSLVIAPCVVALSWLLYEAFRGPDNFSLSLSPVLINFYCFSVPSYSLSLSTLDVLRETFILGRIYYIPPPPPLYSLTTTV